MRRVNPKIFLVAETVINTYELDKYLMHINAEGWEYDENLSGAELLTEIMGRQCYRSYLPGLNANVKKVREGNDVYCKNIIKTQHGSVLEHGWVSFIFADVSRVFTHELVRHRVGTAMSQESLRYVRLTDLGLWLPKEEKDEKIIALYEAHFKSAEELQLALAKAYGLDEEGVNFDYKKKKTSTMRRGAPIGLATSIGFSFNHRTLRFVLNQRSSRFAEVEMREVFSEVGFLCKERWPNLYQDFTGDLVDGYTEWTSPTPKI